MQSGRRKFQLPDTSAAERFAILVQEALTGLADGFRRCTNPLQVHQSIKNDRCRSWDFLCGHLHVIDGGRDGTSRGFPPPLDISENSQRPALAASTILGRESYAASIAGFLKASGSHAQCGVSGREHKLKGRCDETQITLAGTCSAERE